jgi:hypothetical protein
MPPRRVGDQLDLLGDDQQLPTFVLSKASPELQARVRAHVQKVMARPENQWIARADGDPWVYGKAIAEATTAALAAELDVDPDLMLWSP